MEARPLNLLIVEDCADDATLLVRQLRRNGFDVNYETVMTAEAMRAALAGEPWDVVISDYRMPHFSGLEALEVLHQSGLDLPFLLVSGVVGEEAGVEAMRRGAHDYLMKGNLARLAPAVERELNEAEVRRERRREEDLLHLRTEALEAAANSIFITDCEGTIVWVNSAFTTARGYAAAELLGQNPRIFKSGRHDQALYGDPWETILSGKVWRGTLINRHKNGSFHFDESTITPVRGRDGNISSFVAIAQDITERKATEENLQLASEQCRLALQAAQMGAWEWRLETGTLSFDERARSLFSLPAGTELDYHALVDRVHCADRPATEKVLKLAVAGGHDGIYHHEFRVVPPVRWIESFGQTFFEGDTVERRPVRLIGIHADITESKLAELRITEMNRVLDSQLHELQLALTQKTILIQEVQHRVKNNLQIISSLLSLEAERFEDDAVRKPLEESRDRVRAMALMHEQFCHSDDLSRIDFAGFVDRLTSYFLNSHGIGSSKIQLSTDISVKLPMNEAISCGLILQELLSNSIKYAFPDEAGRIRIEFYQRH